MSAIGNLATPGLVRGIGIRQVRITCGLILFAYLLSHFINHALGNISYAAMDAGLDYHMAFWRNPIVMVVFYTAGITHWSLGLWALYERRQFRYKAAEMTQLVLGLSIPFLLVAHFVGVRLQSPLFGRDLYYAQVLITYWVNRPYMEWVQFALLIVAWVHGCIGLYFWLRLKRFFARTGPYLLVLATLIPTLALLGIIQGAREVIELSHQPAWSATNLAPAHFRDAAAARHAGRDHLLVSNHLRDRFGLDYRRARRSRTAGATWRHDQPFVSERRDRARAEGLQRSGGESAQRACRTHSVCGGQSALLDLPHPRHWRRICSRLPKPSRREAFVLDRVGCRRRPSRHDLPASCVRNTTICLLCLVFPPQVQRGADACQAGRRAFG